MLFWFSGAASFAQAPKRVALVIANSAYNDMSFLANPRNDADLIARSLRNANFETVEVSLDLNFENFNKLIRAFRLSSQNADVAIIYYAGHGIENGGKNWLIPVDAKLINDFDLPFEAAIIYLTKHL